MPAIVKAGGIMFFLIAKADQLKSRNSALEDQISE